MPTRRIRTGAAVGITALALGCLGLSAPSALAGPAAKPAAAPTIKRSDLIALTGTNKHLYVRNTAHESGFRNLGGTSIDAPAYALDSHGKAYYVVVGSNHNLYVRTDNLGFKRLGPASTNCKGVSVAISGNTLAVACQGAGSHLYAGKATLTTHLPTVAHFKNLGGTLLYGTTVLGDEDPDGDPDASFGYVVVGTTHGIYLRDDSDGFFRLPLPVLCYGPLGTDSINAEPLACADSKGGLQVYKNDDSENSDGSDAFVTIPGKVVGRPGASTDEDGVTRYYVLDKDAKILTATQDAAGHVSAAFTAGPAGFGQFGIAAGSTSTSAP